jgi:hypothetical protein
MPEWARTFLESGNAALLVVAVMAAEALIVTYILKGKAGPVLLGLLPGLCLVLALRAALVGDGALWIGFWISASLPAHLADLRNRIRDSR